MEKEGYNTSFVTAFEDGKRIDLKQAIDKTE